MFHENLKSLRVARGMTQVDLARKLGVTKQSVSNWENDNIQPSIEMLMRIADALSVSCDYLLGLDHKTYVEVSGLTLREISHIQQVIDDMKNRGSSNVSKKDL